MREDERGLDIVIHSSMPCLGMVYERKLLRLHSDLRVYRNRAADGYTICE